MRYLRLAGIAGLFAGLFACDFHPTTVDPRDQLQPGGVCWDVDLGDGLDEVHTTELHSLYACLNQSGSFVPLAGLDGAMDSQARLARPLGVELAGLFNRLPTLGLDVWALAGVAADLLSDEGLTIDMLVEVAVELAYGRPYDTVVATVDLRDAGELDRGALRPLLPAMQTASTVVLDQGQDVPDLLVSALLSPEAADLACTTVGLARSDDEEVLRLGARLLPDLGLAIEVARSPENDRQAQASGDSLRDLVEALLVDGGSGSGLDRLRPVLVTLLADTTLMQRLRQALDEAETGDHLDPLPLQLRYLVEVDTEGGDLDAGEDTALTALVRLLSSGNTEVDCSIDLGVTVLDVALGNLSQELLRTLAGMDPSTVDSGVSLLGTVLGWDLSRSTLEWIAGTGVCPVIDDQLVADLQSVDRFNDPEVGDLLVVFLAMLDAFEDEGGQDRIPELVDLLDDAWQAGLVAPVEEALRDLADTALADDLTDLVPILIDPAAVTSDACPTGSAPLDFAEVWVLGLTLLDGDEAPIDVLTPVLGVFLDDDATWQVVGNLAGLLQEDGATTAQVPELLARLVALDPDLGLLDDLAPVIADPEVWRPVLYFTENPDFMDALGKADPDDEGPIPFVTRLAVGGTLDTALRTVDLLVRWLDAL